MFIERNTHDHDRNERDQITNLLPPFSLVGQPFEPLLALPCDCHIDPALLMTFFFFFTPEALQNIGKDRLEFR